LRGAGGPAKVLEGSLCSRCTSCNMLLPPGIFPATHSCRARHGVGQKSTTCPSHTLQVSVRPLTLYRSCFPTSLPPLYMFLLSSPPPSFLVFTCSQTLVHSFLLSSVSQQDAPTPLAMRCRCHLQHACTALPGPGTNGQKTMVQGNMVNK